MWGLGVTENSPLEYWSSGRKAAKGIGLGETSAPETQKKEPRPEAQSFEYHTSPVADQTVPAKVLAHAHKYLDFLGAPEDKMAW